MLRRDIGSTFSDVWYRVASSRPRLSPHAAIVRQSYGRMFDELARTVGGDRHIGAMMLHRLERADRLPELLAHLGVFDANVAALAGDAGKRCGPQQPSQGQCRRVARFGDGLS